MTRAATINAFKSEIAEIVDELLKNSSSGEFYISDVSARLKKSKSPEFDRVQNYLLEGAMNNLIAAVCRRGRPPNDDQGQYELFAKIPRVLSRPGGRKKDPMKLTFTEAESILERYDRKAKNSTAIELRRIISELAPYKLSAGQMLGDAAAVRMRDTGHR